MPRASWWTIIGSVLAAGPATAQVFAGVDAAAAAPYVWRGVTRANGWVGQAGGHVAVRIAGAFVSAGAWRLYELGGAGGQDLTMLGPGRAGLAETDTWAQLSRAWGNVHTSLGFIRYDYRGPGLGATAELYGSLRLASKYLTPSMSVWYDIDRVEGAYLEVSGTIPLFANPLLQPFAAVFVRGLVGYSLGQEADASRPGEAARFASGGSTHVDLSLSASFTITPVAIPATFELEGHLQFNQDALTRLTSAAPGDADRRLKLWFGSAVRLSGPIVRW